MNYKRPFIQDLQKRYGKAFPFDHFLNDTLDYCVENLEKVDGKGIYQFLSDDERFRYIFNTWWFYLERLLPQSKRYGGIRVYNDRSFIFTPPDYIDSIEKLFEDVKIKCGYKEVRLYCKRRAA
jgi:hypothetical protein